MYKSNFRTVGYVMFAVLLLGCLILQNSIAAKSKDAEKDVILNLGIRLNYEKKVKFEELDKQDFQIADKKISDVTKNSLCQVTKKDLEKLVGSLQSKDGVELYFSPNKVDYLAILDGTLIEVSDSTAGFLFQDIANEKDAVSLVRITRPFILLDKKQYDKAIEAIKKARDDKEKVGDGKDLSGKNTFETPEWYAIACTKAAKGYTVQALWFDPRMCDIFQEEVYVSQKGILFSIKQKVFFDGPGDMLNSGRDYHHQQYTTLIEEAVASSQ